MPPFIPQTQQLFARAVAAHRAGDLAQAETLYKLVLQADKTQFDALHMLGVIEGQRGNFAAGIEHLGRALRIRPQASDALINLGRMQSELGKHAEAFATYKKALALDPQSALAHAYFSIVLRRQGRCDEALAQCDAALKLAPNYADAWINRGNVLFDLGRFAEALDAYDKAISLGPQIANAHVGRGNVFHKLKQHDAALAAYDRALASNAASAEAWLGRGNVFFAFGRYDDAAAAYDRALALKPDLAEAWLGRGNVLAEFKRYDDALAAFDKALDLNDRFFQARGQRLQAKLFSCNWTNLTAEIAQLLSGIRQGNALSTPFILLAMASSADDQLQCARRCPEHQQVQPIRRNEPYSHDRLRLAYLSSDLRDHAVGHAMASLFEHHDRSRFELVAISLMAEDSELSRRIESSFERFIDVHAQNDQEIADLIRELEIDVLVDLNGFTRHGRPGVLARRAAPIQVNYLGYAGTMGGDGYDYILADRTAIPEEHRKFYSENVVWLPDSFMVYDTAPGIAERVPSRSELQLPESGVVFCCFNQPYKIGPAIFDVWMRLLLAVDDSVLWLKDNDASATSNLRVEAERRGVAPQRLVFAANTPLLMDHLGRQRQADLFLDTVNYNAHTTASDALWAGVPVLTCIGSTFAGRVAASLLRAVGLPELVTDSLADYEALALKIAREPELLASLKAKLARNRTTFPLFDTARFARNIESAYTAMWQRHQAGGTPQNFAVEPQI